MRHHPVSMNKDMAGSALIAIGMEGEYTSEEFSNVAEGFSFGPVPASLGRARLFRTLTQ